MSKCYYCHDARNGCAECRLKIRAAAERTLKSIETNTPIDLEVSGNVEYHTYNNDPMPEITAAQIEESCNKLKAFIDAAPKPSRLTTYLQSYLASHPPMKLPVTFHGIWKEEEPRNDAQDAAAYSVEYLANGLIHRKFGKSQTLGEPHDGLSDWFAQLCRKVQELDASIRLELVALAGKPAYVYARTSFDFHPDPKFRPRTKAWRVDWLLDSRTGSIPHYIVGFWKRRRAATIEQLKDEAGCPG